MKLREIPAFHIFTDTAFVLNFVRGISDLGVSDAGIASRDVAALSLSEGSIGQGLTSL